MEISTPTQAKLIAEYCKRPELEVWLLDQKLAYFAMHAAEKVLKPWRRMKFLEELRAVVREPKDHENDLLIEWQMITATAAQRAEAVVRTLNLWKDE
jgi:hypothetical protein